MRVAVVGAGIAGLTAAHVLSRLPDHNVVLYERAGVPGGRASLSNSGEHCPRVFLDDYHKLFGILRQVARPDGSTLLSAVKPLDRFYYTSQSEWVKISRVFGFQAKELSMRDRLGIARIGWSSDVLAEYPAAVNTNKYSPGSNWSALTLAKAAWKVVRSRSALALDGPTDACLLEPWAADLTGHGVDIRLGREVSAIESGGSPGVRVDSGGAVEEFDAVIVTAFVPDVIKILDASGIKHQLTALRHTHLKVLTVALDPRENILRFDRPALYHSGGVGLLVQPEAARCIAVCIRGPSNEDEYILGRIRRDIDLKFPLVDVQVRSNLLAEEGLYTADYVKPSRILRSGMPRVYFAGSYVRNSYPVDSGEGACLTALNAVTAMKRDSARA
jgi:glycine/D-amino acid oxidase-like deaminating enzyme